jgi:hypothetical protein
MYLGTMYEDSSVLSLGEGWARCSIVLESLFYKPEGRGFDFLLL